MSVALGHGAQPTPCFPLTENCLQRIINNTSAEGAAPTLLRVSDCVFQHSWSARPGPYALGCLSSAGSSAWAPATAEVRLRLSQPCRLLAPQSTVWCVPITISLDSQLKIGQFLMTVIGYKECRPHRPVKRQEGSPGSEASSAGRDLPGRP